MKNFNKNITSVFAVLMILSFAVSMIAVPNASAQTTRATYPYVDAVPRVVGVQQPMLINLGLINPLNGVDDGWNMTLTITDPDGKEEVIKKKTWSTGMAGVNYVPMKNGTYELYVTFENTTYRGVDYLANSANSSFVALEGYWKPQYPGHSMPTEYWTRPVDSQLREWWTIMGSWLIQRPRNVRNMGLFAPYNDAPESAHILWAVPDTQYPGGLSGEMPQMAFQHGDAYEGKFYGAIIVAGVLYYNVAPVVNGGSSRHDQTVRAIDVHTGKVLWEKNLVEEGFANNVELTHGQVMMYFNENNRGSWAYLWLRNGQYGRNWYALNPVTGNLIYNITNVPLQGTGSATLNPFYFGPSGEMLIYTIVNQGTTAAPDYYLCQWNSTRCVAGNSGNWGSTSNTAAGATFRGDIGRCYDWNMSIGNVNLGQGFAAAFAANIPQTSQFPVMVWPGDRAVFANVTQKGVTLSAVSIAEEDFGHFLYKSRTWDAPDEWKDLTISDSSGQSGWAAFSDDPHVGVYWTKENRVHYVFNLDNGRLLWQSEPRFYGDGLGGANSNSAPERTIAYGCLIGGSLGGEIYCYNVTTGELLWEYPVTDKHIAESYHTQNWWLALCFVSDGKAYFGSHAHSAQVPLPRGAPFLAIDIESGEIVWEIDGAFRQTAWGGRAIIGDSVITTLDTYDSVIYGIGKGPSETTVDVSSAVTTVGSTILISGTVTDISPGTQNDELQFRFPKGVPAVSDEDMSEWMLHVYKKFEAPVNIKGVDVTVYVYDGTNTPVPIETTADANGRFAVTYTPTSEGQFEVWASFAGSASYYHSDAQTDLAVLAAPEVVGPEQTPYEWYIVGMGIAILAVVIIFGLLIYLKKK